MSISIDMSEVRSFAADLEKAPTRVISEVKPVVKKAGVNIKKQLRAEMAESTHFKAAKYIDFDVTDGGLGVEVGPRKEGAGNLANIAYFGGANGGGGTVADPKTALDAEVPNFEKQISEIVGGLLG